MFPLAFLPRVWLHPNFLGNCLRIKGMGFVVCWGYMFADWKSKWDPIWHWFWMIKAFVVCRRWDFGVWLVSGSCIQGLLGSFLIGVHCCRMVSYIVIGHPWIVGSVYGLRYFKSRCDLCTGNLRIAIVGPTMSSSIDSNLLLCNVCWFVVWRPGKEDLPEMMLLIWM